VCFFAEIFVNGACFFHSLIVEEAAQILEIETLIPMVLQQTDALDRCRLKRVVLLGDHHQLTPIVRHPYLRSYANLEQSMFSRLVKLGFPYVILDKQGRARPDLAALFAWRYATSSHPLGNLPNVLPDASNGLFAFENAGFAHTHQFVDVGDFQGKGEEIVGTSFQNVGEAEYVVAVYQYMRLLGYPASSISILTTYQAQRQLIRELLNKRCGNALFGMPAHVATVDRFQGQQNDFVLLSLVRSRSVGHIADLRRLVVAVSRARLGLYVFGRQALFSRPNDDVASVMQSFSSLPHQLELIAGESFPSRRPLSSSPSSSAAAAATTTITTTTKTTTTTDGVDALLLRMDSVTSMGMLVYQMVQRAQQQQQQQLVAAAGTTTTTTD
jgi:intron-binding protein aquarius